MSNGEIWMQWWRQKVGRLQQLQKGEQPRKQRYYVIETNGVEHQLGGGGMNDSSTCKGQVKVAIEGLKEQ